MPLDPGRIGEPQQLVFVQISGKGEIDLLERGRIAELRCADQPLDLAVQPVVPFGIHQMA